MRRVDSLEKPLMLRGIGGRRRRGWQRMRWLDGITDSMDVSLCELQVRCWTVRPGVLRFMGRKEPLIWSDLIVPCLVLTVASWPAYRFLKRQVRCSGITTSFRIFNSIVIHTVKGFGIVNKAEIDIFSGTLLLFWWSKGCWQFDLCFLCLF